MEIDIFGNKYPVEDKKDFIPRDENRRKIGHFSPGMIVVEREKYSNFFGKKLIIIGFDLEKEWIFFKVEGHPIIEIYEDNFENLVKFKEDSQKQSLEANP
jgi:hypothetical protein